MDTSRLPIAPLIQGHLDIFESVGEGRAHLRGWILREDVGIERVDIDLPSGPWVSSLPLQERPDVRQAYEPMMGPLPHLPWSGFDVTAPLPKGAEINARTVIRLTPYTANGARLDSLHIYLGDVADDLANRLQPPVHLQERVGGSTNFLQVAQQLTTLLLTSIGKYRPLTEAGEILDWGCGCGRVIAQLMKLVPPRRLHGCDIDGEAIAWDAANLVGPHFACIAPHPPTNYPDHHFDVIFGISVMTHFTEAVQLSWLKELKRIARPGAILALSVIGQDLREKNMPASLAAEFAAKGFVAFVPGYSGILSEFAPSDYYQEAYHSLEYIRKTWSEYFEILECVETKHQDVILLRSLGSIARSTL